MAGSTYSETISDSSACLRVCCLGQSALDSSLAHLPCLCELSAASSLENLNKNVNPSRPLTGFKMKPRLPPTACPEGTILPSGAICFQQIRVFVHIPPSSSAVETSGMPCQVLENCLVTRQPASLLKCVFLTKVFPCHICVRSLPLYHVYGVTLPSILREHPVLALLGFTSHRSGLDQSLHTPL